MPNVSKRQNSKRCPTAKPFLLYYKLPIGRKTDGEFCRVRAEAIFERKRSVGKARTLSRLPMHAQRIKLLLPIFTSATPTTIQKISRMRVKNDT